MDEMTVLPMGARPGVRLSYHARESVIPCEGEGVFGTVFKFRSCFEINSRPGESTRIPVSAHPRHRIFFFMTVSPNPFSTHDLVTPTSINILNSAPVMLTPSKQFLDEARRPQTSTQWQPRSRT